MKPGLGPGRQCHQHSNTNWQRVFDRQLGSAHASFAHPACSAASSVNGPAAAFDEGWQAVYREQAEAMSLYQEAEKVAAARCQVVQERINQDPTARLMLCKAAFRRPSAAWYVVAALLLLVLALGLQLVPRDTWLAFKAFIISLKR